MIDTVNVDLDHVAVELLISFFILAILYSLEESNYAENGELCFTDLRWSNYIDYLETFCMDDLSIFPTYFFIQ